MSANCSTTYSKGASGEVFTSLDFVVCALQTKETPTTIKIPAILSNFIINNFSCFKKYLTNVHIFK